MRFKRGCFSALSVVFPFFSVFVKVKLPSLAFPKRWMVSGLGIVVSKYTFCFLASGYSILIRRESTRGTMGPAGVVVQPPGL